MALEKLQLSKVKGANNLLKLRILRYNKGRGGILEK
jgi:hypothetical protein